MAGSQTERNQSRFAIEAHTGLAFVEDVIEPGKAAAIRPHVPEGEVSVSALVEGIDIRVLREIDEGRYDTDPISTLQFGSFFNAGSGEIVIVFNRGSSPVVKRRIEDLQKQISNE